MARAVRADDGGKGALRMVLEGNYGKAFGFEWHLLDYKAQFGRMPNRHRFIEQGTTKRDRVITFGRWQLVVSKLENGGAVNSR